MSIMIERRFPSCRLRRIRGSSWSRALTREVKLTVDDLIQPVFVCSGLGVKYAVESMPGIFRMSPDILISYLEDIEDLGIRCIFLFPCVEHSLRSSSCEEAWNPDNLICRVIRMLTDRFPDIGIVADVALDPYNISGHDGIVINGHVDNDVTNEALVKSALVQVQAGAAALGLSDMMDGRVKRIRDELESRGYLNTMLFSYTAKYASSLYSPFREAVGSASHLKGDKKTYQMDYANLDEAIHEAAMDLREGADALIVKPGMMYLDVCHQIKQTFRVPVFAYQVSGEYSMICAAASNGWICKADIVMESMYAYKRAGCDCIISYFAAYVAEKINSSYSL